MTNTQPVADIIKTDTPEEYKNAVETEYAPQPKNQPKKMRVFLGVGTYLPKINGRTVKICFSANSMNRYATSDEAVIEYLENRGFKEIE